MQPGLILPPALGGIIIIVVVFNDQNDHRLDYSIGLKTSGLCAASERNALTSAESINRFFSINSSTNTWATSRADNGFMPDQWVSGTNPGVRLRFTQSSRQAAQLVYP